MDVYPLDLVLAVATASATIFLGFLPTKSVRSTFFAREAFKAAIAWVIVAIISPLTISHFHVFIAIICGCAWWKFRDDNAFSGKMWLCLASGLGISLGVMLILAVTPEAYPPLYQSDLGNFGRLDRSLLLASIYLGGGVIGLAYACLVLARGINTNSGVTHGLLGRYVGLLVFLVLARATVALTEFFMPGLARRALFLDTTPLTGGLLARTSMDTLFLNVGPTLVFTTLILIVLAFLAQRAAGLSSRILPTRFLAAFILVGLLAEILARVLVL